MEVESFEKEQIVPVTKAKPKLPIVRIVWVSIAMLLTVVSWIYLFAAHVDVKYDADGNAVFAPLSSVGLWVNSYICSLAAVAFYTVDAVCCVVRAVRKNHPLFHILLAVLLVGAIPMVLLVGGYGLFDIENLIWALYHLACFGMEAVALWLAVRRARRS